MKTVLTIAGFDPSGGAGVLADIKTIARFGCYGVAAVTSLTFQNTQGVFGACHQTAETVAAQLRAIGDDLEISATKIGMLPTRGVVEAVADWLSSRPTGPIVLDPVFRSSSGTALVDDDAREAIVERLLRLASVVTPNAAEAERITESPVQDRQQMELAARKIARLGAACVLVTGGDMGSGFSTDLLLDGEIVLYTTERVRSRNTHGTGCTFSSALACLLAEGRSLRESIPIAKEYIVQAIRTAPEVGKGRGPLNHFPGKPDQGLK